MCLIFYIDLEIHAWKTKVLSAASGHNYRCKVKEQNILILKKADKKLTFSGLFHSHLFQIYFYLWWHLGCSNLLSECIAHIWKITKVKMGGEGVCMRVSVHACMQITQKDSYLLVSLYSFWCLLWQISVRGDFVCWFICEANCMMLIHCMLFEWPAFCDYLKRSWSRRVKLNEWVISCT